MNTDWQHQNTAAGFNFSSGPLGPRIQPQNYNQIAYSRAHSNDEYEHLNSYENYQPKSRSYDEYDRGGYNNSSSFHQQSMYHQSMNNNGMMIGQGPSQQQYQQLQSPQYNNSHLIHSQQQHYPPQQMQNQNYMPMSGNYNNIKRPFDNNNNNYIDQNVSNKKRFVWSESLHKDFIMSVFEIGLKNFSLKNLDNKGQIYEGKVTNDGIKEFLNRFCKFRDYTRTNELSFYEKNESVGSVDTTDYKKLKSGQKIYSKNERRPNEYDITILDLNHENKNISKEDNINNNLNLIANNMNIENNFLLDIQNLGGNKESETSNTQNKIIQIDPNYAFFANSLISPSNQFSNNVNDFIKIAELDVTSDNISNTKKLDSAILKQNINKLKNNTNLISTSLIQYGSPGLQLPSEYELKILSDAHLKLLGIHDEQLVYEREKIDIAFDSGSILSTMLSVLNQYDNEIGYQKIDIDEKASGKSMYRVHTLFSISNDEFCKYEANTDLSSYIYPSSF